MLGVSVPFAVAPSVLTATRQKKKKVGAVSGKKEKERKEKRSYLVDRCFKAAAAEERLMEEDLKMYIFKLSLLLPLSNH